MMFWHNLQIKITTETEDTLRTDSIFCGDMAIQAKCVNKFGTENNFILDYLSEFSRHEANILSKWVWICSPYPPYTSTWYNTPVSCSQIAMSPQNILFKLAYLNEVMYYNGKLWTVSHLYFSFLFRISTP
jgi:hypothetical protein